MSLENMLRSLISQVSQRSSDARNVLISFKRSYKTHNKSPTSDDLSEVFNKMIQFFDEVNIIVDALDEVDQTRRQDLLLWIKNMANHTAANKRLLVTSRSEHDIRVELAFLGMTLCIPGESVDADIQIYVHTRVRSHLGLRRWSLRPDVQDIIEKTLTEKADGMFRWASCQLDALENCLDLPTLKKALKSLPKTLDATYTRILDRIPLEYKPKALLLLQLLAFCRRPLRIEEAVDALAVDLSADPAFDPQNRMPEASEIALLCSSLVSVETENYMPILRIAHFSVKDYLTSDRSSSDLRPSFHETQAHATIYRIATSYLSSLPWPKYLPEWTSIIDFRESHARKRWLVPKQEKQAPIEAVTVGSKEPRPFDWLFRYSFWNYAHDEWNFHGDAAAKYHHRTVESVIEFLPGLASRYLILFENFRLGWHPEPCGVDTIDMTNVNFPSIIICAGLFRLYNIVEHLIETSNALNSPAFLPQTSCQETDILWDDIWYQRPDGTHSFTAPLYFFAYRSCLSDVGRNAGIVRALLECGAPVSELGGPVGTALSVAHLYRKPEIIRIFKDSVRAFYLDEEGLSTWLNDASGAEVCAMVNDLRIADTIPDCRSSHFSKFFTSVTRLEEMNTLVWLSRYISGFLSETHWRIFGEGLGLCLRKFYACDDEELLDREWKDVAASFLDQAVKHWPAVCIDRIIMEAFTQAGGSNVLNVQKVITRALILIERLRTYENSTEPIRRVFYFLHTQGLNPGKLSELWPGEFYPLVILSSEHKSFDVLHFILFPECVEVYGRVSFPLASAGFCVHDRSQKYLVETPHSSTAADNSHIPHRNGLDTQVKDLQTTFLSSRTGNSRKTVAARCSDSTLDANPIIHGRSLLHWAVEEGKLEDARLLLSAGADASSRNERGKTPLHVAVSLWNVEIVKLLISNGCHLGAVDHFGCTPLHTAAMSTRNERIHTSDWQSFGLGPLPYGDYAEFMDRDAQCLELVQLLLSAGADINFTDKEGLTLLHYAVNQGDPDMVRLLVEARSDNFIRMPLHSAVSGSENAKTIKVPLSDPDTFPISFLQPYMEPTFAKLFQDFKQHTEPTGRLEHQPKYDGLHNQQGCGSCPGERLLLASTLGWTDLAYRILERGPAFLVLEARDDTSGKTALHYAAEKGYVELVEVLILLNAEVSARDKCGRTALHLASAGGHPHVIQVLLHSLKELDSMSLAILSHTPGYTLRMVAQLDGFSSVHEWMAALQEKFGVFWSSEANPPSYESSLQQ